ncbi:tellurite resistance protein [Corynebacterium pseudopelargi]|uniref:C4-dicarboxylate transporter/malic acid transport protein n=1 Tax=Corynebacterium pseudopelargi TaxID=2080757 RepID=A0A3G6IRW1_9CORY|nr:tellurite resistance protein [Corynebacterium pseudopelargi]AZA08335.1 C4-dicarboxylate transporter/malic acid transport protein [Corynebacterium pseudopelargi]
MKLRTLGPAWSGALMGTSISATLSNIFGLSWLSYVLLIAASILLLLVSRKERLSTATMPAWGMYSMGVLALGTAYSTILGLWWVHAAAWFIGGVLSVITCLWYTVALLRGKAGPAAFTWGLPLVAPMVTATSSAQLGAHLQSPLIMHIGMAMFFLAWCTGVPTFVVAYLRAKVPLALRTTTWIPLGIVGQSTAAAHLLWGAHLYGVIMLSIGVPLVGYALYRHWSAVGSMPYNPSWFASTFPVGTVCLGAHLSGFDTAAHVLLVLLLLHLIWAATGGAIQAAAQPTSARPR